MEDKRYELAGELLNVLNAESTDNKMCSLGDNVANEMDLLGDADTCGDGLSSEKKREMN